MPKFAEILVHKQKIYTYEVPSELTSIITVGQEVIVPLRGKSTGGYVIRLVKQPLFKTLLIKTLISPTAYFDEKLVELAAYIAEKYKCLFATAMKPILPKE